MKIRYQLVASILLFAALINDLDSQTFPYWDTNNPNWLTYGPGEGSFYEPPGGGIASLDENIVAANGIVYAIYIPPYNNPLVMEWTLAAGWQTLAQFSDTDPNNPGAVWALNVTGGFLYVGGWFNGVSTNDGQTTFSVDNLVEMNLTNGVWTDLGHGNLAQEVFSLTVDAKANVYVAAFPFGPPYDACDDNGIANDVSAYTITNILLVSNGTNWSTVGNGIAGVGGSGNGWAPPYCGNGLLPNPGSMPWSMLGTDGTNVFLASPYLYGVNTDGSLVYSPDLIKWNGTQFQAMGVNAPEPGIYDSAYWNGCFWLWSMVVSGTNVFVTGLFNNGVGEQYPGVPGQFPGGAELAQFSTSGQYIPTVALLYTNGSEPGYFVYQPCPYAKLATANGIVYVTGNFDTLETDCPNYIIPDSGDYLPNTIPVSGIAQWDGTTWSSVGGGLQNGTGIGYGSLIAADTGAVYVEGVADPGYTPQFNMLNGETITNYFIRWVTGPELTRSMNDARCNQTATLLTNGEVLVAGGYGTAGALSSAELYNPATGIWTQTGSLNAARDSATATLLTNGEVLVVGGNGGRGAIATAELYNPAAGTWTLTGSLSNVCIYATATLLNNGEVLVAGGYKGGSGLPGAQLYNPATGTWTLTGSMNHARYSATATLLTNGEVLVAGGFGASGILSSTELYNPATGTWTSTGSMNDARWTQTATLLTNGEVLVAGGENSTGTGAISSAELYNQTTGTWQLTGSMNNARALEPATLLPNGQVLVVGGSYGTGGYLSSAELYNPATGTWTLTTSLNYACFDETATLLLDGEVLVAGGSNGNGAIANTELYY